MGKILIFISVVVVAWLLFKGLLKKPKDATREATANSPERMVKCDLCGVFMPESDIVQLDDKRTCGTPSQCLRRQTP